ncbi:ABC transporter substrate-binding protein [Tissierella carlieri]|uniref:ABC transporter substrate-binding protein n=1 Tax=Tissierella carlieri TaxID=689904 RepID=A0ABT1SA44_9FIRM|nr:ABC transporter substrate-binding protein [Tissierella carlieri]MCQ4923314.1 ABC transporter substrate-binding protein [Tissierella carlieri]
MSFCKRGILILLAIVLTISMVGCKPKDEPKLDEGTGDVSETLQTEEIEKQSQESGSITITDHLGREIILDKSAEKIVSGYYITTSMMIALGLEDNVVGIEAKAKSRNIYALAAPEFLELPNVGTAKEFDLEGCIALEPDLVILPVKLKEAVESLEALGINVIAVNPEDMDLLKETLIMIGKATGTEDRAKKLISYYDEKISEIGKITENKEQKKVYLGGNSDFLSTAPKKMYQNYMIETAGGINVASDIEDTYWATISYEQLLAYNPDVIIIAPSADYTKDDIINNNKLSAISAMKNRRVYVMPDSFEAWDAPIPSSILGTMWLTSILHEEDYSNDTFKQDVADFYKEFYDIEINKEDIIK